jgi:diguanylate cyclase (GGDEF)-like protein
VPHQAIAIYLLREKKLVAEFVSGDNSRLFSALEIPLGQGLSGWVAQNRKPILNGNPSVEPGYLNDPTKFSTLRSAVAVPLEGATGVLGVLALYGATPESFSTDHLRVLLAISSKLGVAIENALKYRMAETSATTDYLTGLMNARSLFHELDNEIGRCRREKKPLQLFVCDLNGFKEINDNFGHLEGNKLLRAFAERLKEACRGYDCVARMGGDEFVVVAPGLPDESVAELTRRIQEIAAEAGQLVSGSNSLSVSVGAASFPDDGASAEELLTEADRRMYVAKQQHYDGAAASGDKEPSYA